MLCFLLFVLANAGKVGIVYFLFGRAFAWPHHMLGALAAAAVGFGLLSLPGRRWFLVAGYAAQQLFYFMHVLYFLCLRQFFHFSFGGNLFFESVETLQKLALPYEPQALIVLIDAPLFAVVLLVYPSLQAALRGYVRRRLPAALALLAIVLPVAVSQGYVLMIQVESLGAESLNAKVDGQPVMRSCASWPPTTSTSRTC